MNYEPATFWIVLIAWVCAGSTMWLLNKGGWWVVIPVILLVSSSFTLAIIKDLKDMDLDK